MIKKKGMLLPLFILLFFVKTVYGSSTNSVSLNRASFFENFIFQEKTSGTPLFFMCQSQFSSYHNGSLVFLFGNAKIGGRVKGDVYSLFAEIEVLEDALIEGKFHTLSSVVSVHAMSAAKPTPLFSFGSIFHKNQVSGKSVIYSDKIPNIIIFVTLGFSREVLCLIILGFKKGFFEQGSVLIYNEPQNLLRFGLISGFIVLSLILVFLMSVVGVFISVLIGGLAFLMSLCGLVSLNMYMGELIASELLKVRPGQYQSAVLGGVIIEFISFLPFMGLLFNLFFMPVLCLGIFSTNIINGFIKRKYYETPYDDNICGNINNEDIRSIILKNK